MKNCIFILLWCIPGFLFSVTPKPDVEKLTETADTYYQAGKVDSALWAIEQALQLAMTEKDTCAMMSCYTSQGVYLRSSGKLTEAIAAYDKALQYAPLLSGNNEENLQAITTLYNNLATVYLDMKNPAQAVKYALDASRPINVRISHSAHRFIPSVLPFSSLKKNTKPPKPICLKPLPYPSNCNSQKRNLVPARTTC